ncbi:MAG: major capsid protein [Clostridia bacterium]|nr:major capsid protein [Clostridia bacterium]
MPANFDLFSTAVMLKAVEQMPRKYTFLSDTFVADGDLCEDERAIYDYRKGAQTGLAPFIVPGTGGVPMNREGYEMREIRFSTIAPERVITLEDISSRMFGENITGQMTPEQRSKRLLARDLTYLREITQNRRNWMAREVLLKGKLEIKRYTHEGVEKEASMLADFGFTNYYTPATLWNQPGAKINYDMEATFDMVYDGLGDVDILILGAGVFEAMMANSDYCKTLDMDHVYMGEIRTKYQGQGVRYRGTNSDGVAMVSYSGKFLNDDRQMEAHIPAGTILLGSRANKPLTFKHGPITKTTGQDETANYKTFIKKEVPFRIGGSQSDSIATRLVSRPTVVPENVGAWAIMKVL